jgi:transposase InsO family protein
MSKLSFGLALFHCAGCGARSAPKRLSTERTIMLLKRERRSGGLAPINTKRVYRLMKMHGLLLEPHTGRRRTREHNGQVATIRSNTRWCSDALKFTCWNGEGGARRLPPLLP